MPDELLTENVGAMIEKELKGGNFAAAATLLAKWMMASSCKGEEHGGKTEEKAIKDALQRLAKREKLTPEQVDELQRALKGELSLAEVVKMLNDRNFIIPREVLEEFFVSEVPFYKRGEGNPKDNLVPALFAVIDQGLQEVRAERLTPEKLTESVMKMIRNLDRLEEQELLPKNEKGEQYSVTSDFINATVERDGQQVSVLDLLRLRREESMRNNETETAKQLSMLETLLEARSRNVGIVEEEDPLKKRATGWNSPPGYEKENDPRSKVREEDKNSPASLDKKNDPRRDQVLGKWSRKSLDGLPGNPDRSGANPNHPLRVTKSDK